jgi:phage repressor protein C with HTH and peptisase S24 domain
MDSVRAVIARRVADLGLNLTEVSTQLGKNHAYLQQFLKRGIPAKLKEDTRARLAEILMVDESELGGPPRLTLVPPAPRPPRPTPNASAPMPIPELSNRRLPVYGVAVGGSDGRMKFNGELLDMAGCPDMLNNVPNAYAVDVAGESMVPVYRPGMRVWINPNLYAKSGDEVIIQILPSDESEAPDGYIKELVKRTPSRVVVKQYNPEMEIEFDAATVVSLHVVVFSSRR